MLTGLTSQSAAWGYVYSLPQPPIDCLSAWDLKVALINAANSFGEDDLDDPDLQSLVDSLNEMAGNPESWGSEDHWYYPILSEGPQFCRGTAPYEAVSSALSNASEIRDAKMINSVQLHTDAPPRQVRKPTPKQLGIVGWMGANPVVAGAIVGGALLVFMAARRKR